MAYIGKVKLTTEWEKLEDLIKAQVAGQSAFAFDTSKEYSVQAETPRGPYIMGAYLCNTASEPSNLDDGEHLEQEQMCVYQPESGQYLWVRSRGTAENADVKLSVSEK